MAKVDENKEGIKGMINPTRYGIERFAYLLMRLTGLGLLAYFLAITQTPEGHIILAIVIGMSVYHTVNGIRVMLGQGGIGVGKPARPDYPYTPQSQNARHKIAIYSSIVLAALAMMYGLAVMFGE